MSNNSSEDNDYLVISKSLRELINYATNKKFKGYDPYDGLNSKFVSRSKNSKLKLIFSQILVYLPLNLRPLLAIQQGFNPKGIALFIKALCILSNLRDFKSYDLEIKKLSNWLIKNRKKGYNGACWGYNFPWQSAHSFKPSNHPTIVTSSFVADSLLDAYDLTGNDLYLEVAKSTCDFILKDIVQTLSDEGLCFSYSVDSRDIVHNANALGGALLARVSKYTDNSYYKTKSKLAFDYLVSHQKEDGSWNYNKDLISDIGKKQIDWHQGFIIDSLITFLESNKDIDAKFHKCVKLASNFYAKKQFSGKGQGYWRYPQFWPIDIHNQAQGIITFSKLSQIDKSYLTHSKKIAIWSIKNMQDSRGYFYFQKWPFFINKISYMRWSQAWMSLALSTFLINIKDRYN